MQAQKRVVQNRELDWGRERATHRSAPTFVKESAEDAQQSRDEYLAVRYSSRDENYRTHDQPAPDPTLTADRANFIHPDRRQQVDRPTGHSLLYGARLRSVSPDREVLEEYNHERDAQQFLDEVYRNT